MTNRWPWCRWKANFPTNPVLHNKAFIDIPGNPMILRFAEDETHVRSKRFQGPATLDIGRFGMPAPERLVLVSDDLFVQERQLMTALPSSREDFAFFQAQRDQSLNIAPEAEVLTHTPDASLMPVPDLAPDPMLDDGGDSYGTSLETDGDMGCNPVSEDGHRQYDKHDIHQARSGTQQPVQ